MTSSWPEKPLVGPFVPDELTHAGFRLLDTEIDRRRTYARYACVKL